MIEISQMTAMTLYLCLTLGTLLGVWAYQHYSRRHRKMNMSPKKTYVCEFCHFCYLDNLEQKISKCPQCQSYNEEL